MHHKQRYLFEPPFKDELVTSWIVRNALHYGIKPSSLSTLITANTDAWKGDLDTYISPRHLKSIVMSVNIDESTVYKLSFYGSCDYFYNQTERTPQVKWVMPLSRGLKKTQFGLQYCPCCLANDGKRPYFRKHWRLAFMTACPEHSVQLHDQCPNCLNPIDLKRLQKNVEDILYHPEDIVHCATCGFDLRTTQYTLASSDELEINHVNYLQSTLGYGSVGNLFFSYSNLYFEGIRRLLSFLVCSPKGKNLFLLLLQAFEMQQNCYHTAMGRNLEPERLSIDLRRTGLIMIRYLLTDWPESFVTACKASNTSSHLIKTPYLEFPYWVIDAMFFRIQQYKHTACNDEKASITAHFNKHLHKDIKPEQAQRYMTYYFK